MIELRPEGIGSGVKCWCEHPASDHWFLFTFDADDQESRCLECGCRDYALQPELELEAPHAGAREEVRETASGRVMWP